MLGQARVASRSPSMRSSFLVVALALAAGPAFAAKPAAAPPAPSAAPATPSAETPPAPVKATPEQRAEADRLGPIARAAFWAREADVDPKDAEARLKLARSLRALGRYAEAGQAADQLLVM